MAQRCNETGDRDRVRGPVSSSSHGIRFWAALMTTAATLVGVLLPDPGCTTDPLGA